MQPREPRMRTSMMGMVLLLGSMPVHAQRTPRNQPGDIVYEASISDLQAAMTSGRASSASLVDGYLARIAAYDHAGPALNAIIRLNPHARADAMALDAERRAGHVRGPMYGIPVILKDNYATRDMPTAAASIALAGLQLSEDAFQVKRLRDAGAVILGKSNMHELAAGITSISSLGGQTCNPYDPDRNPGGSSGGSGAAVAARCRPVAVPPVKLMALMPGCSTMACPQPGPVPCTMLSTPAGRPASIQSSLNRKAVAGVISEGLATTQQPTARAGAIFQVKR